ncbi:BadF/BadG/BcrA/BcrD ATPase family protein [Microbacterium pseudoresistens]|uniref:N-acetylglucosamine kinase-like BadF-type ATPase n=1 Tax=Microbacterium pseudoresistens TaxID=640634 RepID=A0A7Y9JN78_9MICO|nr:BadF/BadG/BcrA/BcrD ATPase family protein [Microbacterium pseudoresistens]NYD55045.1 N-acetylglucosamine kinase-like BadF-type ATPase [Microbacterium pseudoresistens]
MGRDALLLGIDAGGTSTRAVLATHSGDCVGYGVGGPGNPTARGVAEASCGVAEAVDAALRAAGGTLAEVVLVVAAVAGHDAGAEARWLDPALRARGFTDDVVFESDLLAAYASGSVSPFGYGVVCGTGASVIRVEKEKTVATSDGLGWMLGDRGSGFWIGRRVVRAAAAHLDGTGPETALTEGVLTMLDPDGAAVLPGRAVSGRSEDLDRLIRVVYAGTPARLAGLTPLAFTAAGAGDAVGTAILTAAGEEMLHTFRAVRTEPGPVVIGGSVLSTPGPAHAAFLAGLDEGFPPIAVVDGTVGTLILAMRRSGIRPDEAMRQRITDSLRALRAESSPVDHRARRSRA